MKSAEQMAREVLERRDAYRARQRRRQVLVGKVAGCAAALLCVLAVSFGVFQVGGNTSTEGTGEDGAVTQMPVVTMETFLSTEAGVEYGERDRVVTAPNAAPAEGTVDIGSGLDAAMEAYKGQEVRFSVEITLYSDEVVDTSSDAPRSGAAASGSETAEEQNEATDETTVVEMTVEEVAAYVPPDGCGAKLELASGEE